MTRFLLAAVMTLVSGTSISQMMGGSGPMSTAVYFPLVDGARYDYMYTAGPWSSSTVVMHTGQTWAGVSGLTAMHTTYACVPAVACAPDATDFYQADPDGVRYFGGMGADPAGMAFSTMTYTAPEWMLKNPVTPGTMMAGGGYQNIETWHADVVGSGSMMGGQNFMSRYQALALETMSTPAGTFANVLHVREQHGNGYARDVWYAPGVGLIAMNDGTSTAWLTGYTIPGAVAQPGGGAAALAFTPMTGGWWNPDESGSGYTMQVQHGVLVMTMLSYTADGDPIWYLGIAKMANAGGGVAATGKLDKYRDGQCASCAYEPPALNGNDGTFTVMFTSPDSATIELPGGRATTIRPMAW
jgi:hypothetical protein